MIAAVLLLSGTPDFSGDHGKNGSLCHHPPLRDHFFLKDARADEALDRLFGRFSRKYVLGENLPPTLADMCLEGLSFAQACNRIEDTYDLVLTPVLRQPGKIRVFRRTGEVSKEAVRLYERPGGWTLAHGPLKAAKVMDAFTEAGISFELIFRGHNLLPTVIADRDLATGEYHAQTMRELVEAVAKGWSEAFKAPKEPPVPEVAIWPLTFVGGDAPNPTDSLDGKRGNGEKIAATLNELFGEKTVAFNSHRLFIKGKPPVVRQIRTMLAQWIDIPYSQVRLDVWTIQVNTQTDQGARKKERAQENLDDIRAGIQMCRDVTALATGALAQVVQRDARIFIEQSLDYKPTVAGVSAASVPTLRTQMVEAGFDPDPERPLTLAEAMVFLALALDPKDPIKFDSQGRRSMESFVQQGVRRRVSAAVNGYFQAFTAERQQAQKLGLAPRRYERLERLAQAIVHTTLAKDNASTISQEGMFPRFAVQFDNGDSNSIRKGIYSFFQSWNLCRDPVGASSAILDGIKDQDFPAQLAQSAAGADILLKAAMTSLTTDIQELTTQPLLNWIRTEIQQGNARGSGIDLVGNTTLTVTSRLDAAIRGEAEAFYPFTPRPKLTEVMVKDIFGLAGQNKGSGSSSPKRTKKTTTTTDKDGNVTTEVTETEESSESSSPAPTLPIGVANLEAAALFKMLFNEDTPTAYNRVAPGISIGVLPTVLRDGGSARLQIHLASTMQTDTISNDDVAKRGQPLDRIGKHLLKTDVAVSALDLFELSTFGMEHTSLGDPQWRVPLLAQLPILGPLFWGPRSRVTKHQESLLIVNATVLPKALDLAGRYVASGR